jgi:hypothetical protein
VVTVVSYEVKPPNQYGLAMRGIRLRMMNVFTFLVAVLAGI